MTFVEAIKSLDKQLQYQPEIVNDEKLGKYERFIFVGMGGSALGPDLLKVSNPELDILIHRDYGLPDLPDKAFRNSLVVLNSYSGNTEEVIESFNLALSRGFSVAVVSKGGKLLELANKNSVPYIQLPDWSRFLPNHSDLVEKSRILDFATVTPSQAKSGGLEPRLALGLSVKALLKIAGQEESLGLISDIKLEDQDKAGENLAKKFRGFVPVIYSSRKNGPLAYAWKVKINETAKKPAFSNVFPELNHNEMAGFDTSEVSKLLSQNFHFIFLKDSADNPKILKRMEVTAELFRKHKLNVEFVELAGDNVFAKIFSSLQLADWVSYYIAKEYGVDPADISVIEEFKKML